MKNTACAAVADTGINGINEAELLVEQAYEALDGETANGKPDNGKSSKWENWKANFKRRGWILLFILPALIYVLVFCYAPMYGILIAFQDYGHGDPIIGPDTVWVGWNNFSMFFSDPNFWNYFSNTFLLCFFGFIVGFPLPIIVALLLNSLRSKKAKKGLQILYYAPHFI